LAVAILLLMVVIHEFGHYTAGKLLKFKINEFSVGFGPKIISKKLKNGEVFSLRAVPLGGYCAFEDESGTSESTEPGKSFVAEKPWKRLIVFFAGAFFNLVSACIFSFIFILIIGYAAPTVNTVCADEYSNPYNALLAGDRITAVNGKKIGVMRSFSELTASIKLGETAEFTVIRDSQTAKISAVKKTVARNGETPYEGFGFVSEYAYNRVGIGSAALYSVPFTGKMSWTILGFFGKLFTGQVSLTNLSGPVGTVTVIADHARENWRNILILLPLIASNLAVFNLLPIPALDGSKMVFTTIEWVRGKPVNRNVENIIHFAGLILIFGLVIIIDIIGLVT
jgi:regulator of sigma E protease